MNSSFSVKPRFSCRLVRVFGALTSPSNSVVSSHCESCDECRSYFSADQQWENALRVGAPAGRAELPPGLERRIELAVTRAVPTRPRGRQGSWALGGLATGALAAVTVLWIHGPIPRKAAQSASTEDVVAIAKTLPRAWIGAIQPRAVQLVSHNSLQTELTSVQSDAKSALNFLALNFLPTESGASVKSLSPSATQS